MKPPICRLCHQAFRPGQTRAGHRAGLVRFADYVPLPGRTVGHPKGLHWFCGEHFSAAQALADLPTAAALSQLRASRVVPPSAQG